MFADGLVQTSGFAAPRGSPRLSPRRLPPASPEAVTPEPREASARGLQQGRLQAGVRGGGGERAGERGGVWRVGHREREELQKRGGGGTGFMQIDANEGAETARLGMPRHSPLGVGCGRLDPSQGLRVSPWVMVEWPGRRAFSCSLSLAV